VRIKEKCPFHIQTHIFSIMKFIKTATEKQGVTQELCLVISTQASQELNYHTLYSLQCVNLQHLNTIKPQLTATYLNSYTIQVNPLIPALSIQCTLRNTWNLNCHPFLHMFLADDFRCMKTKSFFRHHRLNNKKHPLKNK